MASNNQFGSMVAMALVVAAVLVASEANAQVGVCYGTLGNDLPSRQEVVALYQQNKIGRMRIYAPDLLASKALSGSSIELILGVPDEDLQRLATDPSQATAWVKTNIIDYWPGVRFKYIAVGNELIPKNKPTDPTDHILGAIRNIYTALSSAGLQNDIKVSTAVHMPILGVSYPPSQGELNVTARKYLVPIVQFLAETRAPLLVNIYPYFSYKYNPNDIKLPYALFTSRETVVDDDPYKYWNLFDAMLDAVYAALERAGYPNLPVVVSESGWPSGGGFGANMENARAYNQNLIKHATSTAGTPRKPGKPIEFYIFAMFNENQKRGEDTEKNFGLFYPSKQPVYPISF